MLEIIQGEDQDFSIFLRNKSNGQPVDLTAMTEIEVCFKVQDVVVSKTLTAVEITIVGSPLLGNISGSLSTTDTDSLSPTKSEEIQVNLTDPDGKSSILIDDAFSVIEKKC